MKIPNSFYAMRMALTSAWAVGSLSLMTLIAEAISTWPSRTMIQPNGPHVRSTTSASRIDLIASDIWTRSLFVTSDSSIYLTSHSFVKARETKALVAADRTATALQKGVSGHRTGVRKQILKPKGYIFI